MDGEVGGASIKASKAISRTLFSLPHRNSISSHHNVSRGGYMRTQYDSVLFSISHTGRTREWQYSRSDRRAFFFFPLSLRKPLPFPSVVYMTFLTRRTHHRLCGSPSFLPSFLFRYRHSDFVGISPKLTTFIGSFRPGVSCERKRKKGFIPWHRVRTSTDTMNQIGFRPLLC